MQFHPGHTYHLYNQGNNRQQLFFESENYLYFLKKVRKDLLPYCNIIAWCLMPNHFHFLIQVHEDYTHQNAINNKEKIVNPLNRKIGSIQSSYTKAINNRYNRTGSLFRQRTKAKILSDQSKSRVDTAVNCFFYIHQNPLKAGLVRALRVGSFLHLKTMLV